MKPKFTTHFRGVVIWEGADELNWRVQEGVLRSFIDTSNVGDKRWRCPPVDVDAGSSAEGSTKNGRQKKERAKALWSMRDAKVNGKAYYVRSSERHIVTKNQPRWKMPGGARKMELDGLSPLQQVEAKCERRPFCC